MGTGEDHFLVCNDTILFWLELYLALARRLAGNETGVDGRAHSLEALFAEARRNEYDSDELLVEGDWEDGVELPPVPFPVATAPTRVEPLDDLPLFATDAPVDAPACAPTNGKAVTLDELALMVRRRKPRPRPAPEGQLALFTS
jgi:hypothetical protein